MLWAGGFFEPGQQERRLQSEPFEKLASRRERFVEQHPSVEPQHVEDDEHDRHLAPQLRIDLLATEPALQLEEPQHAPVAMRQNLTVEQHVVSDSRGGLDELGKRRRRLFQVA